MALVFSYNLFSHSYQTEVNALPLADPGQILKAVIATDDIFAQADAET